jgi:RNA polymerase sigma-70 factor (ECF subfamily)
VHALPSNDDAALVTLLRTGDQAAFTQIVRDWSPLMLHVARTFVTTPASAEECVQEAWIGVIRGLDGFEGRARLRTWTLTIVSHIARRRAERDGRTIPLASLDGEDAPAVDSRRFRPSGEQWAGGWTESGAPRNWEPEPAALTSEALGVLMNGLNALPVRQRAVVALRDIHGLTPEEVCAALDVSAANQRVLLHRGRSHLRRLLERYYDPSTVAA